MNKNPSITTGDVELVLEAKNQLGECPLWDIRANRIWWIDILSRSLHSLDPKTKCLKNWSLPERVGSFALTNTPNELLMAFESGLAYFNYENYELKWLKKIEPELSQNRLNDGRCDRQGRFWVGSMNENEFNRQLSGNLYRFSTSPKAQSLTKMESGVAISNSLAFSPDNKHLYFSDSFQQTIWRYKFNSANGTISSKEVFVKTDSNAHPDGSTVDSYGNLWNAQWGASQIVCYSPEGNVLLKKKLPVSQPSCLCFGDDDLQTIYITSARTGLAQSIIETQPHAGSIFRFRTSTKGLAEGIFQIT